MAILTINHYINQANAFISSVRDTRHSYYVFAAKPSAWPNEGSPPSANSSLAQYEQGIYTDLMFGKLIQSSDVTNMIPRNDWTSNTVYAQYDQNDANLYSKQFFVVTSNFEVYKCIYNNGGANSTVMPTLNSTTGTFTTGDGYIWKYMYTVDSTANTKFTSANYIPVSTNTQVAGNTVGGTIDTVRVINGGNNYQAVSSGFIKSVVKSNVIELPPSTSSVDNYYACSSIYLKAGPGAGQLRKILTSNGVAKTVTVSASEPFTVYDVIQLSNVQGTVSTGYTVSQSYSQINYVYSTGYFSAGANVIQSDTGAFGQIVVANTTVMQIVPGAGSNSFSLTIPIRDNSDSGTAKTGNAYVTNVGALTYTLVTNSGSGYTGNATVTVTDPNSNGTGGTANAGANSIGRIANINISAAGTKYFVEPTIVISAPANTTFNAQTAVVGANSGTPNNSIALTSAANFQANDLVTYRVASGNTVISGLTSGTTYYIDQANSTYVSLKTSLTGSRITIAPGLTETGHALQGATATGRIIVDNQLVKGGTGAAFTTDYANGDYIRVSTDYRRIANTVNSTLMIVDTPFRQAFSTANTNNYKLNIAAEPISIVSVPLTATVVNTNLTSVTLTINSAAFSLPGAPFIIGEKVNMVDSGNNSQSANAIVAFANTLTMVLSAVQNQTAWANSANGYYVRGESSLQRSPVVAVKSNPNITTTSSLGTFLTGRKLFFSTVTGASGNADIVQISTIPNDTTEYVIGPTISVSGDGSNVVAIAVVNTAVGTKYEVTGVQFVNNGVGYTSANLIVVANGTYGSGANITPIISPVYGHGYDAVVELGGRYVGVSSTFDTATNETNYFPSYGAFRKVGILEDPQYTDVRVTLNNFDRVNMTLTSTVTTPPPSVTATTWYPGEVVVQSTTNAAGVVVYGNSTFLQLKNVLGTFNTANTIQSYYTNTVANVASSNVNYFVVGSAAEVVSEVVSGATGIVTQLLSNTSVVLSNVMGQFVSNDVMYDAVTNSYATVNAIYTANGSKDQTSSFGDRFNQTLRLTLTSNTGAFANGETVVQDLTNASAYVISTVNEVDLAISSVTGSFSVGSTITDATTSANGILLWSNSTYMKLTSVSTSLAFGSSHTINSGTGSATVTAVYPVLTLNNVDGPNRFQAGNNNIIGQTTTAFGTCNSYSLITYPELIRDTGRVIYLENFSPVTRATTTKEDIRMVIRF